jgi:hypothetical protein
MKESFRFRALLFWLMAVVFVIPLSALAQSTAFTYQGRLTVDGTNVSGTFDFTFTLFDSPTNGNQVGGTLTNGLTPVAAGRFTVPLDFGIGVFDGTPLWLELGIRPSGSNVDYTVLSPNQALTATPYALYALSGNASGLFGIVPDSSLSTNVAMLSQGVLSASVLVNADAAGTANSVLTNLQSGSYPLTNVTIWASNDLAGVQAGALTLAVTPSTNPGVGVVLTRYQSVYSNDVYNGIWRSGNNDFANTLGDPQWDNTWHNGFNYNGGNGSPVCTNQASWMHQVESDWQNYPGVSQMEDWYGWGTPYTACGTNFSWRFQGGTISWNTATHAYLGSQWGFSVDNFYLNDIYGNTVVQINSSPNPNSTTGIGAGSMTLHGPLTMETNWNGGAALNLHGSPVNWQTASGGNTVEAALYPNSQNWYQLPLDFQANSTNICVEFANFGQFGSFQPMVISPGMNDGGTTVALKVGPQYYQAPQTADLQEWCGPWAGPNPGTGPVLASVDAGGVFHGDGSGLTNLNWSSLANLPVIPSTNGLASFNDVTNIAAAQAQLAVNTLAADVRNGVATIAGPSTTVTVTFSSPLPDTNYSVVVTPEFNTGGTTWWVDTKTTSGFNFNLTAVVVGGGNISYEAKSAQ